MVQKTVFQKTIKRDNKKGKYHYLIVVLYIGNHDYADK